MSKLTFEDLKNDPWRNNLIKLLEKEHGSPLPTELQEFLIDQATYSGIGPKQIHQWVITLNRIVSALITDKATASDLSLFWIKLHAILDELNKYFSDELGIQTDLNFEHCNKLIKKIRNCFNEGELFYIEHERHCACHVTPQYYRKKFRKDKSTSKLEFKDDYNGVPVDVLTSKITEVIKEHNGDNAKIAKVFASRIKEHLSQLQSKIEAWLKND